MDVNKCPYCFRPHGTWQKDPILLPKGCPYVWVSETELTKEYDIDKRFHKGCNQICEPEVQEIQDFLKQAEINYNITPLTEWSPLNIEGKFQITGKHIKEMRDSVEKMLTITGLTKTDYFNKDEEGNTITRYGGGQVEWTDPITNINDLQKFQVKYIHIEELRHNLASNCIWVALSVGYTFKLSPSEDTLTILGDAHSDYTITADPQYNYICYQTNSNVYKVNKAYITQQICHIPSETGYSPNNRLRTLCVDDKYIWLSREIPYTGYGSYITQIDKVTMEIVEQNFYHGSTVWWWINCDSEYLYLHEGTSGKIIKINKTTKSVTTHNLSSFYSGVTVMFGSLGMDDNYFYSFVRVSMEHYPWTLLRVRLLKVNKSFSSHEEIDIGIHVDSATLSIAYCDILVDKDHIYAAYIKDYSPGNTVRLYCIDRLNKNVVWYTDTLQRLPPNPPIVDHLFFQDVLGGFFGGRIASEYSYQYRTVEPSP